MRWLALILLVANVGLWYYAGMSPPVSTHDTQGRLPRVSDLRLNGESRSAAEGRSPARETATVDVPEPDSSRMAAEPVTDPQPEKALYCVRLGWFKSRDQARVVAAELVPGNRAFRIEEQASGLPPLHWVIIPPRPAAQALNQFRDIQRQGIDSYLVTEGEHRNAISLGLFESREAAKRVLRQRNAQNLNAVLAMFPRNQLSYALFFEAGFVSGSKELEAVQADYSSQYEMAEIERCEGIATTKKSP